MKRIVDIIHGILNEDFPNFDVKSEPKNKNKTLHSGDINLRDKTRKYRINKKRWIEGNPYIAWNGK